MGKRLLAIEKNCKWNAASLLYVYEWKLCSSVVTSINTDLVDKTHSVTLRTDTMYMHP